MPEQKGVDELMEMRWYALSDRQVMDIIWEASARCLLTIVLGKRDNLNWYATVDRWGGLHSVPIKGDDDFLSNLRQKGLY
jgi:hypothetical protein